MRGVLSGVWEEEQIHVSAIHENATTVCLLHFYVCDVIILHIHKQTPALLLLNEVNEISICSEGTRSWLSLISHLLNVRTMIVRQLPYELLVDVS
jgi:hypothetical protein